MESKPLSLKIGVSGVRGIVGESLTPQLVTSFCAAFGSYSGAGPIVIGTDTRPSREMVKQAAVAGLLSVGCTPVDVGIVPIPSLMLRVRELDALGGVCISASHHPIEWNALKFIGPGGIVLRPNQAAELTDLYHQGVFPRVGAQDIAEPKADSAALLHHREAIFRVIDVNAIRRRRFRVAVDCCNGAASTATPEFLRELGCEVVELNTNPDEPFPHGPEPVPENIGALGEIVRGSKADVGFAQDADADRVAIVNERGEAIGEDCTVALGIYHWLRRHPGPVVVNVSTSRMVDDIAASHGCEVHRTRVGEINVVEAMLRSGAEIGGEGNGGIVLSRVHPCRDSFVGMALILEALAMDGATVSELRARIPTYAMVSEKLICPARDIVPSLRLLRKLYHAQALDLTDGVKVVWPDRWLHARPSTTEPVIRLHAEAPTRAEARELLQGALECLSPTL